MVAVAPDSAAEEVTADPAAAAIRVRRPDQAPAIAWRRVVGPDSVRPAVPDVLEVLAALDVLEVPAALDVLEVPAVWVA